MKKKILIILIIVVALGLINSVLTEKVFAVEKQVNPVRNLSQLNSAEDFESKISNGVNIYFFWGEGCPHCEDEKQFLEKLEKKYPEIKVNDFEVWNNSENRKLLM